MSGTQDDFEPRDPAPQTTVIWTLPNVVSLLRLLGVPLFLWLVLGPEADLWAVAVLMISGFTDWLDGYLARRLDQTSKLGEILDPVADRLYILAVVLGLAFREIIPWWVAIILPARDAFLWLLVPFLRTRGYSALPVHFLGKAATFNLLYAFPLLFVGDPTGQVHDWNEGIAVMSQVFGWAFAIWGMGLYWWAGLLYAWQVRKLLADRDRRAPVLRPVGPADPADPGEPMATGPGAG
ncbi:MAG: CDP-alcohol phosphatidyltransferase family protein [Propionibacteriales bacterium]|nr:CDP-alcohol phosphatidyltransferase family protein [Propionibacteriales bacterium]